MDLVETRIVLTVVSFVVFVAIVVWAYSPRARRGFEAAARLPFEDDAPGADRRTGGGDA